jgi:sortase (surface protein transpeptidase)
MVAVEPARIVVPALGVDAPVIRLGLQRDGTLEVPATAHEVGWWSGGTLPGTTGPAVLAGHVNLGDQRGVFARLAELAAGDRIDVADDDGTTISYVVTRVERHPKDAFPTDAVYDMTAGPELRLITCGGDFDRSSGHYEDNVIAYATPA